MPKGRKFTLVVLVTAPPSMGGRSSAVMDEAI